MVVSRATALPLITIPVILDLKLRRNNLLHQNSEPSMEMVGGNMGVIADILSGILILSAAVPFFHSSYRGMCLCNESQW